jgi:hypothetical protein
MKGRNGCNLRTTRISIPVALGGSNDGQTFIGILILMPPIYPFIITTFGEVRSMLGRDPSSPNNRIESNRECYYHLEFRPMLVDNVFDSSLDTLTILKPNYIGLLQ